MVNTKTMAQNESLTAALVTLKNAHLTDILVTLNNAHLTDILDMGLDSGATSSDNNSKGANPVRPGLPLVYDQLTTLAI